MNFTPTTPFKLWLGDRLCAAYAPEMSYTVRDNNAMLRALVMGGTLPDGEAATVEMPDLSQTEIKPGEECPGWAQQGLVVITGLRSGGLAGTAEVKEN